MKKTNILLSFLLAGSLLISCNNDQEEETENREPIEFNKEGELFLIKSPSGDTIQKLDIEIAENQFERETGLMHRYSMENDQGMLFIFNDEAPRFFHMEDTYIPLDILFFSSDSTVVSLQENTTPLDETSLSSEGPAQFVLEINAGLTDQWNIELGDKIDFKRTN